MSSFESRPAAYSRDPIRAGHLADRADLDITRRAMHGTWTSIFIFLVLAVFTSYFKERPRLAFSFAILMALIIGLRLWLQRWPSRTESRSRRIWKRLYLSTIILMGLSWGLFYGLTVLLYGYGHWTTLVLLICVTGVVSGATTSFAPNRAIMQGFLIVLVGPSLVVDAIIGNAHGYAMGLLFTIYLIFSLIQGRRRSEEYWNALADGELLKRRADELEKARQAAEASSRAKGEFLANISHELRTPMNGVIGMTELTLASDLAEEQRQDLEMVKSSAESLLKLLNDLLDYSKIEAGKLELETIPFSLRHTMDVAVRPLAILARRKGLDFTARRRGGSRRTDRRSGAPSPDSGESDRQRREIYGTRRDRRHVSSGSPSGADDLELLFTVTDTGIGVPENKRETDLRSFLAGGRLDDAPLRGNRAGAHDFGATGQNDRWKNLAGERMGRGSRFYFTARFGIPASPRDTKPGAIRPVTDSRALNVLLVDDNPINQKVVALLLGRRGHNVVKAANGSEAIDSGEATLRRDPHGPANARDGRP